MSDRKHMLSMTFLKIDPGELQEWGVAAQWVCALKILLSVDFMLGVLTTIKRWWIDR